MEYFWLVRVFLNKRSLQYENPSPGHMDAPADCPPPAEPWMVHVLRKSFGQNEPWKNGFDIQKIFKSFSCQFFILHVQIHVHWFEDTSCSWRKSNQLDAGRAVSLGYFKAWVDPQCKNTSSIVTFKDGLLWTCPQVLPTFQTFVGGPKLRPGDGKLSRSNSVTWSQSWLKILSVSMNQTYTDLYNLFLYYI